MKPLTEDQKASIRAYAGAHGRRWKSILSEAWESGRMDLSNPHEMALYRLRNTHGPRWLKRLKVREYKGI